MQYSNFYHTKTKVSRLGFGAFGLKGVFGAFDETEAIDAMHYCWNECVNFLDTARHHGESEAIIKAIGDNVRSLEFPLSPIHPLGYATTEEIWQTVTSRWPDWYSK
ncbi:MAG: hypothetical protein AB3N64_14885 [Puniceicoccaceae bacterium]